MGISVYRWSRDRYIDRKLACLKERYIIMYFGDYRLPLSIQAIQPLKMIVQNSNCYQDFSR